MFSPLQHASMHTLIVRPLLHAIFTGQLPGGTHLVEQDLAAQFQVSSAPVREALREIASMGLVELRPNRGTIVLPFTPGSLRGIYHVRIALESEAARLAAPHILPAEADEKEKAFLELLEPGPRDTPWSMRAMALDEQFHEMIAARAGVDRLANEIRRYCQLAHLIYQDIREFQGFQSKEQEKAVHQVLAIVKALQDRDPRSASEAMRDHLLLASEGAIFAFFKNRIH